MWAQREASAVSLGGGEKTKVPPDPAEPHALIASESGGALGPSSLVTPSTHKMGTYSVVMGPSVAV